MQGGVFRSGRYELRQATMLDLIKTAYGVDPETVVGGPSWLESDRFDVTAKAPPATSAETANLMLQALLTDRFKLVVHKDMKLGPRFVLTVGKGKPKLKETDGSGELGCQLQTQAPAESRHDTASGVLMPQHDHEGICGGPASTSPILSPQSSARFDRHQRSLGFRPQVDHEGPALVSRHRGHHPLRRGR